MVAADVLKAILHAENGGSDLDKRVQSRVGEYRWQNLAVTLL
jgi:hypothetical protein